MYKVLCLFLALQSFSAFAKESIEYKTVKLTKFYDGKFSKCANTSDGFVRLTGRNQEPFLLGYGLYNNGGPLIIWRCNVNKKSLTQTTLNLEIF